MQRIIGILVIGLLLGTANGQNRPLSNPRVALETNLGTIVVELMPHRAPTTVKNFVGYVEAGFYDGTLFHRVIPHFMIQAGGFSDGMKPMAAGAPIKNEAENGLSNRRGTIAMARTQEPHSATSQFFINTVDNIHLDHKSETREGWGYTVFGRVVEGMEVVDRISNVRTHTVGHFRNVPVQPIRIEHARRMAPVEN